jgi:1,2-diacylglycerol 3-alpha-glucosyltransferase
MLADDLDITLFKSGGPESSREVVIHCLQRNAAELDHIHVAAAPRWAAALREEESHRIEHETFAYGALRPLLEGRFDVIHCLEQEVCRIIYANRHLFARVPKIVFSNGGAIPAAKLPPCDFVQEHTQYNLRRSDPERAFFIPHGVDSHRFSPDAPTTFRARHGIPPDARVVLSVGTVCYWHKRMDYVIREVSALPSLWLVIIGQDNPDTLAIKALGQALMPGRIVFTKLPHEDLPEAYAAADIFVLGSLFETFGIVYIEAMSAGLPVISTDHPNQRGIIQQGVFIDMKAEGALTQALRDTPAERLKELGEMGRAIVLRDYDVAMLRQRYIDHYAAIDACPSSLPIYRPRPWFLTRLAGFAQRLTRALSKKSSESPP